MNKYLSEFLRLKSEGKKPKWREIVPPEELASFQAEMLGVAPAKEPIRGLGDVVHAVTEFLGIPECGGCGERREKLNQAVPFGKQKTLE